MKYSPKIAVAFFREQGIPEPELEYQFHSGRRWRFDFAWPRVAIPMPDHLHMEDACVALEVDGGIWIRGGHNRGAQMKKTWEKENTAQIMGWKILKVEPKDLCLVSTANMIKQALGIPLNEGQATTIPDHS